MSYGDVRLISFYLPQYHPVPENDQWWGKGFTEWANVAKAKPSFPGHYQPHLPSDLGFYDLRVPEVREAQAKLAKEFGINGFCYYHYWFNGKQLLERPFQEVVDSGKPEFPFCLCWANENWTRKWDGHDQEILVSQGYSEVDDREHIKALLPAFRDRRYITVRGKPIFLVYKVDSLPNPMRTAAIWKEEVLKAGLPGIYLCTVTSLKTLHLINPEEIGFDAAVDFQPDFDNPPLRLRPAYKSSLHKQVGNYYSDNLVISYADLLSKMISRPDPMYKMFPGVTPGWDNTARRKNGAFIILDNSPDLYAFWLRREIVTSKRRFKDDERLVFINAWNEWGEGNHLEPDQQWGLEFLRATRRALDDSDTWRVEDLEDLTKKRPIQDGLSLSTALYPEDMANNAFWAYTEKDMKKTRYWATLCLITEPRWIRNKGLISILVETIIGSSLMNRIRKNKRENNVV